MEATTQDQPRRWYSSSVRAIVAYAVIFSVSVMLLLGYLAGQITHSMEVQNDKVIEWQMRYFDTMHREDLSAAIRNRLEHEPGHASYYGLFAPDGRLIAGDLLVYPSGLRADRKGYTLTSVTVVGKSRSPVVRAFAEIRGSGNRLVLARDMTNILNVRAEMIRALVVGGLVCLLTGALGGAALSLRQMRRIRAIREVTQRIARGDLGQRLPVGGRDEIDMLAHLVNHMLAEVERLMHEVKGVCDGIAHDLRTPLAHVHTLLAHAAEQVDGEDPYEPLALSQLLDQARSETDDLLARFRSMLRIADIGTLQRRGGFESLNLQALVGDVAELYEPLAEEREIHLEAHIPVVSEVYGDRALLFEALSNLVDNALKYTPTGGCVRLELRQSQQGPTLSVTDNGPGIDEGEREAVLRHRYRSARTGHLVGSGLGLSIVSAVINVHDFTLRIEDAAPGTRIVIDCWPRTLA